ncbi:Asp23/Gls24 family envelope stress response protein [Ferdinandcohnia quinoae]|uniref:Asp23/Gls24 family envelope stress response protein n=1 Tax=Fredinandcohnia quinoae TaxID=2918902 RepID=A0AAW5E462_9BACI|nr:Asp23/Gls24 family envelope stress response protein [Fredinandcohnia sp. SECRCQ15]MCH1623913.1 Asp23/Gls24 family envelope stress response protein [Fredinandcohnia sp. SECRCQ15]
MVNKVLEHGTLYIKNEVLAMITSICIDEMDGIKISTSIRDGVVGLINRNYHKNGIMIINQENELQLEIKIALQVGMKIIKTCEHIQKTIIQEIKAMTGIRLLSVKISVEELSNTPN